MRACRTCRCRRRRCAVADLVERRLVERERSSSVSVGASPVVPGDDDAVGAVVDEVARRAAERSMSTAPSASNGVTIAVRTSPSIVGLYRRADRSRVGARYAQPVDALADRRTPRRARSKNPAPAAGPARRAAPRREPRQQLEQRLDVALLVEDVCRKHEVERAPANARQSAARRRRRAVRAAFCRRSSIASSAQSIAVTDRPARGRDERRDAEPAAELDDASRPASPAGSASREREPGRPELGPVRHELVAARTRPRRSAPRDRAGASSESSTSPTRIRSSTSVRQSSASSPTVSPGGSSPSFVEREQDARHERLARGRVVADREDLARRRRGSPPGARRGPAAAPSGSARRRPSPPRSPSPCPDGASSFVAWCSSMISARAHERATPRPRSASSARRRSRSSARGSTATPALARLARRPRPCPSRSSRRRRARRPRARGAMFGTTASGAVKSTIASASASASTSVVPELLAGTARAPRRPCRSRATAATSR